MGSLPADIARSTVCFPASSAISLRPAPFGCATGATCASSCRVSIPGPLPSWNDGPAKQAVLDFIRATTDQANPTFVKPEERIATFDQDGTLWVEHPMYTQVVYCLDRVPVVVKEKPEGSQAEVRLQR